jgi:hypothetical protein
VKEIDEIRLIERAALIDKAVAFIHQTMGEIVSFRSSCDEAMHKCEVELGELLAAKALLTLRRVRQVAPKAQG